MNFRSYVGRLTTAAARPPPFDRLIGARFVSARSGKAVLNLSAARRHHNPTGVVHGGAITGLADSAMAYAVATRLAPDESCTNTDLTVRFLRPTIHGKLTAHARVEKAGRTLIVTTCRVLNGERELVAMASSTWVRLKAETDERRRSVRGRASRRRRD